MSRDLYSSTIHWGGLAQGGFLYRNDPEYRRIQDQKEKENQTTKKENNTKTTKENK